MNCIEVFGKRHQDLSPAEKKEYRHLVYMEKQEKILLQAKKYRTLNREKVNAGHKSYYQNNRQKLIDNLRKKRYQLSDQRFEELLRSGCYAPGCTSRERLVIDHDHLCCPLGSGCSNCVRGALCNSHNVRLGYIERDPVFAQWALDNIVGRVNK